MRSTAIYTGVLLLISGGVLSLFLAHDTLWIVVVPICGLVLLLLSAYDPEKVPDEVTLSRMRDGRRLYGLPVDEDSTE